MKRYGGIALFFFTLLLMSVLSILQGTNAREKLALAGSLPSGSAPVNCAPADVPCLALTFDLDPGADNVPTLLSILKEHHVKATFFVTGQWLSSHQSEAKAIADGGHELGNHTENHPDMTSLNEKAQTEELTLLHSEVLQLTGVSMTLFPAALRPLGQFCHPERLKKTATAPLAGALTVWTGRITAPVISYPLSARMILCETAASSFCTEAPVILRTPLLP